MIEVEVGDTVVEFPDGTSPEIMKGALQKRFGAPKEAGFADRFQPAQDAPLKPAQPQGAIANALEPITSYPETYSQMNRESRDLMSEGATQAGQGGLGNAAIGAGKMALGGVGYVTSPINAALRTVIGKPVENITGAPKELTEFAAGMVLPIPKRIPTMARAEVKAAPKAAPSTEELFAAADKGYKEARASGFTMAPEETIAMSKGIADNLTEAGYRDFLAPKTFRALGEFKTDAPSNVADIEAVRRALNIAAKDPAEKDAARRAITAIDDTLGPKVPAIADARANYAAGSRAETIQEAGEKAALQAGSANSGQNIQNATRQQFKSILNSPARRRGFSANELAQMELIVKGTKGSDAARFAGNLLGGGGGLGAVAVAGVGGMATGGIGAIAPIFGYGFKKLGNHLTQGQVAKLDEMVRSRAPQAKAVGSSVKDWSEAVQTFETSPSLKAYARVTVASRNLANNLHGVGIATTPDGLLKSIQGGMGAAAEDEQPSP